MKKLIVFILTVSYLINSYSQCGVYGKIRLVDYGEDVKVRVVNELDATVNLKVKVVGDFGFSDEAGLWELVHIGEKFKVKLVDYGEDFTVQFVSNNWGCGNSSRHSGAYTNPQSTGSIDKAGILLDAIEREEQKAIERRKSQQNKKYTPEQVKANNQAAWFLIIIGSLVGVWGMSVG